MFRGVTKLVLGVGFAGVFSGYTLHMLTGPQDIKAVQASTFSDGKLFDHLVKSNSNLPKLTWDQCDSATKDPQNSPTSDDEPKKKQNLPREIPSTATRHILLIRHGQYNNNGPSDEEKTLTALGWEQAEITAKRLKSLAMPYTRIVQSSMTRAKNTATVLSKYLGDIPVDTCDYLREGVPAQPNYSTTNQRYMNLYKDGARIEAAFRRYFHRAGTGQTNDSYEILACHANVIRYFICRALQFPVEAWLNFALYNCSITWLTIRPSGRVTVYSIGDIGHMPPEMITEY